MELDRPNLRTCSSTNNAANNNTSELFICFASRLSSSSSSMKIAKSILSPGRAACDGPISLSNSLSRRLRSNGSIKGGQGQASPMFPSVGRKKGCNFENPEPSSPKVTCIGQVRVKTKKKANQTQSLSRRRSGDVSFRKGEQQAHEFVSINNEDRFSGRNSRHVQECLPERNQRWVHFPVTICEALRTVGSEFSCLFPCRSPCFSTKEREEKLSSIRDEGNQQNQNSCGAVFARWFVSLQDCEGRQARQIELVVGGDEDRRTEVMERRSIRSSRRHAFEDIEFNQEMIELKAVEREEEKARVSICVPPKNALLLMRCRSDPMKMAALNNRVWEPLATEEEEEDDEEEEDAGEEISKKVFKETSLLQEIFHITKEITEPVVVNEENEQSQDFILGEDEKGFENVEKDVNLVEEMQEDNEKSHCNEESQQVESEEQEWIENGDVLEVNQEMEENIEESEIRGSSPSRHSTSSRNPDHLAEKIEIKGEKSESEPYASSQEAALEELQEENGNKTEDSNVQDYPFLLNEDEKHKITTCLESEEEEGTENGNKDEENDGQESAIHKEIDKSEENDDQSFFTEETKKIENKEISTTPPTKVLPDCLLLMMCEPKLSMDMSKETWVCSTDFVRWLPERPVKKVIIDESKKKNTIEVSESNPSQPAVQDSKTQKNKKKKHQQKQTMQPPRSSCTLPAAAAASMATMIEQKLVNAVGYEPFVLTRCKSEPMRTAAAKLVPEACCWKNRKLEPHHREAFGVGAAGLGF